MTIAEYFMKKQLMLVMVVALASFVALSHAWPVQAVVTVDVNILPETLNTIQKGLLPVAILGTGSVDVADIDLGTIELEGVTHVRAVPAGPDIILQYDAQAILSALGGVTDGEVVTLTLTGELNDGAPISGADTITIVKKR